VIGTTVLFFVFLTQLMQGFYNPYVVYPAVILITLYELIAIRFCDTCGATNHRLLKRNRPCRKCGRSTVP
jgi:hypothetical protein